MVELNTWQVAAGSFGRDYSDEFLRLGMAFVGGEVQIETMAQISQGDHIILKRGMSEVVAVGRAVQRNGSVSGSDDKAWLQDFDGWELPAYCYVDWHVPQEPISTRGLTRATIQAVIQPHLIELAKQVIREVPACRNYDPEPAPTQTVEDGKIVEFLVTEGLRPAAAEDLTAAFRRIRMLARYYYNECKWDDIREHETRTFLIMPLLLALGWAEQQIKIELPVNGRRRVDVACFSRPYCRDSKNLPNNDDCVLILESKDFKSGLDYAPQQAQRYSDEFLHCRVVAVSNGYCYKTYVRRDDGAFQLSPSAYINLLNPQDRYPIKPDTVDGALEALRLLMPHSWR
ncbi:MAG: hypothetical protein IH906_09010 [Proteobacteria bacterium]|nr:hypothetical protein [Pseudomonadota bacterium]